MLHFDIQKYQCINLNDNTIISSFLIIGTRVMVYQKFLQLICISYTQLSYLSAIFEPSLFNQVIYTSKHFCICKINTVCYQSTITYQVRLLPAVHVEFGFMPMTVPDESAAVGNHPILEGYDFFTPLVNVKNGGMYTNLIIESDVVQKSHTIVKPWN